MATIESYTSGEFCFTELTTQDPGRSLEFYAKVLGWSAGEALRSGSSQARGLYSDDELVAGLRDRGARAGIGWLNYVTVTDIDQSAARIVALGGKLGRGT